jgi:hypothetical protein
MGLRAEAESVLSEILEDEDFFAWPITVTDPSGLSKSLTGRSTDIGQVIDPDTGLVVSGRAASVALRISTLTSLGFTSLPRGIADASSRPWKVAFDDINGNAYTFKVMESAPDRAIGIVVCHLEIYAI